MNERAPAVPRAGLLASLPPGRNARMRIGEYQVLRELAAGGMGCVYLAERRTRHGFAKRVALKTIHAHLASDPRFVRMFLDEARLVTRLEHPNVCTVFDFGEADGTWFLAMEYLRGRPLSEVLTRSARGAHLSRELAAGIIADAALGLHAAHELKLPDGTPAGVVHRDVSPQNVFVLYDGVAKVVDFGIAFSRDRVVERTETGHLKGKIAYMAPEQLRTGPVDRRADVFALGVLLWEATVGARLFRRGADGDVMIAVLIEPVPRPSERVPDYPPELEAITMRALARDPDARYPTARELAAALTAYLAGAGRPAGATQLAEYMQQTFAAEITAFDRASASDHAAASSAPAWTPDAVDRTSVDPPPASRPDPAPSAVVAPEPAPARWKQLVPLGIALAIAALGATALLRAHTHDASVGRALPSVAPSAPLVVPPSLPVHATREPAPLVPAPAPVVPMETRTEPRPAVRRAPHRVASPAPALIEQYQ